jgi:hypothetical protein
MMVGIDDGQIRIEDLLGQSTEPFGFGQRAGVSAGFDGHGILPKNRLTISWITGGAVLQNLLRNQSGSEDNAIGITLQVPPAPWMAQKRLAHSFWRSATYPRMMEIEARR